MTALLAPSHYIGDSKAVWVSVTLFILENEFTLEKCFDIYYWHPKMYQYLVGSPSLLMPAALCRYSHSTLCKHEDTFTGKIKYGNILVF